jgi:hypothetical protein
VQADSLQTTPTFCNFIVAFATLHEHVALRDQVSGAFYIQSLCNVLNNVELTNTMDVLELLNEVSKRLGKNDISKGNKHAQTTETKILGPFEKQWFLPYRPL